MLRLGLLILPLALLTLACSDGSDNDNDELTATVVVDATETDEPAAPVLDESPTPLVIATPDLGQAVDPPRSDAFSAVSPFALFGDLGSAPGASLDGPVDPDLGRALIRSSDLPAGFTSLGEMGYSAPSEYGPMEIAMSIFSSGDLESGQFDAMVASAVLELPPSVLAEIHNGLLDQMATYSDEDLAQAIGGGDDLSMLYTELDMLDASGLGEGGLGIHMVIDFGLLAEIFGAPEDEAPLTSLGYDMFLFLRGTRAYVTMVMFPGDAQAIVDAHGLGEIMDARAG
jgi:hypothetical protein